MPSIRLTNRNVVEWYSEKDTKWPIYIPYDENINQYNFYLFKYEYGKLVYIPDITPIDKTIEKCVYDWSVNQVRIYIKDIYITEPITAVCDSTWTDADCQTYIDNLEITR